MRTKDGSDWQPTDEQVIAWEHAYPDIDVFAEMNQMTVWLDANPGKRKTERGMARFVNSWLSRANRNGGSPFAQEAMKQSGKTPMRGWTQLDDLTHDYMNNERFRQSCLNKYGQYVTLDGVRVTK